MKTQRFNKAEFKYATSKEQGELIIHRNEDKNISKSRTAEINNIPFSFCAIVKVKGKTGLLVKVKELKKIFSYLPESEEKAVLRLTDVGCPADVYKRFSKTTYSGKVVNSGYGFYMKDTKTNWDKVNQFGYDAIEKTY